ncbi:MAG: DNA polymerase III subunit gamma/tau [Bacteroidota bacterium]|nr:DNA polymerase III subunit gamma/tau [Bacteroidota bacterium]MDX5505734.1 DNA polymerase III subunit gamma/tau [Bacteroidota bacterium]
MENYIVSARKYRPQAFEEVVGQQHITRTLETAIKSNHLAQALLFCGPRGVGKTTCARILARLINEETTGPDQDYSLNIFELDAASNNSVDDIRHLIDQVRFAPQVGQYKVYIIDEVHMLSASAFNAFLKTLEEPPKHAIFILATTEKHKIIPTILSRCQIFDFKRITVDDIAQHLAMVAEKEGIKAESEALHMIAQKADGALRDSLSIFDRIASFSGNEITYQDVIENLNILDYDFYFKTVDKVLEGDVQGLLLLFDEILSRGFDGHLYINGLSSHLRDLLVSKDQATLRLLEVTDSLRERYRKQSETTDLRWIIDALKILNDADVRYKGSNHPRLMVELTLVQMVDLLVEEKPLPEKKKSESSVKKENKESSPDPSPQEPSTKEIAQPAPVEPPATPIQNTPSPSSDTTIPEDKKEPKEGKPPKIQEVPQDAQRVVGKRISLSRLKKEKEEEKKKEDVIESTAPRSDQPRDPVSPENLLKAWKDSIMGYKDRPTIYNVLSVREPLLEGDQMVLVMENQTQEAYFNEERQSILTRIRKELNNYYLDFQIHIERHKDLSKPYTPQEKFAHMSERNPLLKKLKDDLELDLE